MLRRHVERFEVVPVVLGLGTVEDLVALPGEDAFDARAERRQRVRAANWRPTAGQRHVDRSRRRARRLERGALLVQRRLDLALQLVGLFPEDRTLLGRCARDVLQKSGQGTAFATKISIAQRLEVGIRRRRRELASELRSEVVYWRRGHREEPVSEGAKPYIDSVYTCHCRDYAVAAPLICAASFPKLAASRAAISASALRSSPIPARFRPAIRSR